MCLHANELGGASDSGIPERPSLLPAVSRERVGPEFSPARLSPEHVQTEVGQPVFQVLGLA